MLESCEQFMLWLRQDMFYSSSILSLARLTSCCAYLVILFKSTCDLRFAFFFKLPLKKYIIAGFRVKGRHWQSGIIIRSICRVSACHP